jgi:hypothetical protein
MLPGASLLSIVGYVVQGALGFIGTTYYAINSAICTAHRKSTTTTPVPMANFGHVNEQDMIKPIMGTRTMGTRLQNKP